MKRVILDYARPQKREYEPIRIKAWIVQFILPVMVLLLAIWVLTPRIGSNPGGAQHTKTLADIDGLRAALDSFRNDNGRYPTTAEGLQALIENPSNLPKWQKSLDTDQIPSDPWGHDYIYRSPGKNGESYDLLSAGPDGQEGTSDDISN